MSPHRAVLLALLAVVLSAAPARAGAVPDSATRASLQRQIGHLGRVRIGGRGGQTLLLKPVVREDGLRMREPWHNPRPAFIVIGEVPAPPPPVAFVPWSEIDEVQVPRGDPLRGSISGAIFGAGLSAIVVTVYNGVVRRYPEDAVPIVITGTAILVGVGASVGAVVGSYTENWRTIYPALPAKQRR
jgi:hypothetical protein